jgi:Ca2+-binding EF-hand superfamily protein
MEFIQKRDRLVLTTIAQSGPNGIDFTTLIASLTPYLTRESIQKSIENLFIKGDIISVNTGSGEVRYIASKTVRDAMISLEIQKYKIAEYVKELSSKKDEIIQLQDKNKQLEELKNIVSKGLILISLSLMNLYSSPMPELTIPEFIESMQPLSEVLSKLSKVVDVKLNKEDVENILKIVEKYRGVKDYELLKQLIEKGEEGSSK